jgi:hypothetical protein
MGCIGKSWFELRILSLFLYVERKLNIAIEAFAVYPDCTWDYKTEHRTPSDKNEW